MSSLQRNNFFASSLEKTINWIAHQKSNKKTPWIFLNGDLGAGKTTFTQELLNALGYDASEVQSPTFLKLLVYKKSLEFCIHMDAYRIQESAAANSEFIKMGLDEYEGLSLGVVEWPLAFEEFLKSYSHFCEVLDIDEILDITLASDRDEANIQFVTRKISLK